MIIEIDTKRRVEIVDITGRVREAVGGKEGNMVLVYTTHTTTGLLINEAESGLMQDIIETLAKLIPERADYRHDRIDNNADAHLRASLVGNSVVIPVENGNLMLGTWQRILFIEFDGPRRRRVVVKVI